VAEADQADPVGQLALALDVTGQLIESVRASQWEDPTPCSSWLVRDLIGHLVGGNNGFAGLLDGSTSTFSAADSWPDDELAAAYRASAAVLVEAFSQPGAMQKVIAVPFGTVPGSVALHLRLTELLTHGWDLARATGQTVQFPDDLAQQELAFTVANLPAVPPGRRPFGPPQPVAGDAPVIDKLAACLGRDVTQR
jgi:uncharacterized protein (TIGR03086 family)